MLDNNSEKVRICFPPVVSSIEHAMKEYTEYISSLSVAGISSIFSATDIPVFRRKYQIPESVRIRAPGTEERACYYRPGEICFYESAFKHMLRFPIDDYLRELLAALDVAPVQIPPTCGAV